MRACLTFAAIVVLSSSAWAHTTLTYPEPRTLDQKEGPCGATGSERGTNISVFEPGETITVTWDETIDHPGHFRIAFDESGDDDFPNPSSPEDDFPSILVEPIADRSGGGPYSQEITFPDVECEDCTLQLVQIMTVQVPYNSFYFQCADIALRTGGAPPDGGPIGDDAGCAVAGGPGPVAYLVVVVIGLVGWRRRRD